MWCRCNSLLHSKKKYGCRVIGIDFSDAMINRLLEKARGQGVDEHVEFRLADIGDLPFEDGEFDMVLGESVLAFIQDK